jgi:hypothetical protein
LRVESDEIRALRSFEDAVRRAKDSGDGVDLERAHQKAGCCSDPKLRIVMARILHGAATLDDALCMVSETLAHEECS